MVKISQNSNFPDFPEIKSEINHKSNNLKTQLRKSFFPMLIFNEENACSTFPFQNEEKIVWFPNNFLRNAARLPQKQSEIGLNLPDFFIGIDVDLLPSPQFVEDLSNFISTKPQEEGFTDQSRTRTDSTELNMRFINMLKIIPTRTPAVKRAGFG